MFRERNIYIPSRERLPSIFTMVRRFSSSSCRGYASISCCATPAFRNCGAMDSASCGKTLRTEDEHNNVRREREREREIEELAIKRDCSNERQSYPEPPSGIGGTSRYPQSPLQITRPAGVKGECTAHTVDDMPLRVRFLVPQSAYVIRGEECKTFTSGSRTFACTICAQFSAAAGQRQANSKAHQQRRTVVAEVGERSEGHHLNRLIGRIRKQPNQRRDAAGFTDLALQLLWHRCEFQWYADP